MALSADRNIATVGPAVILHLNGGDVDILYKGAIVMINSDGYVEVAANEASAVAVGVVKEQVSVTAAHEDVEVETGMLWIPHTGAAQTDVGTLAYGTGDDAIDHAAGNNPAPLGLVVGFKTGYLLVDTRTKAIA